MSFLEMLKNLSHCRQISISLAAEIPKSISGNAIMNSRINPVVQKEARFRNKLKKPQTTLLTYGN